MSKRIKQLVERDLRNRLSGSEACVVVDFSGVSAEETVSLRRTLRAENITMLVVKNSLARRALAGTALEPASAYFEGPSALCYGGEDAIALARVVVGQAGEDGPLTIRGGTMEGQGLSSGEVGDLAKLPTREELIAGVVARALAPVRRVVRLAQSAGQRLAAQIATLAARDGGETDEPTGAPTPGPGGGEPGAPGPAKDETERGENHDG